MGGGRQWALVSHQYKTVLRRNTDVESQQCRSDRTGFALVQQRATLRDVMKTFGNVNVLHRMKLFGLIHSVVFFTFNFYFIPFHVILLLIRTILKEEKYRVRAWQSCECCSVIIRSSFQLTDTTVWGIWNKLFTALTWGCFNRNLSSIITITYHQSTLVLWYYCWGGFTFQHDLTSRPGSVIGIVGSISNFESFRVTEGYDVII